MDRTAKSEARKFNTRASVIPAPRKSVKRIMFETMVDFSARSFSSQRNSSDGLHDGSGTATPATAASGARNIKRIYPTTHHN